MSGQIVLNNIKSNLKWGGYGGLGEEHDWGRDGVMINSDLENILIFPFLISFSSPNPTNIFMNKTPSSISNPSLGIYPNPINNKCWNFPTLPTTTPPNPFLPIPSLTHIPPTHTNQSIRDTRLDYNSPTYDLVWVHNTPTDLLPRGTIAPRCERHNPRIGIWVSARGYWLWPFASISTCVTSTFNHHYFSTLFTDEVHIEPNVLSHMSCVAWH